MEAHHEFCNLIPTFCTHSEFSVVSRSKGKQKNDGKRKKSCVKNVRLTSAERKKRPKGKKKLKKLCKQHVMR